MIGAVFGTDLCASTISGANFTNCTFGDTTLENGFVVEGIGVNYYVIFILNFSSLMSI